MVDPEVSDIVAAACRQLLDERIMVKLVEVRLIQVGDLKEDSWHPATVE